MSETMSKKDQKAIRKAEEIIAEAKQNGLKDGALIVLRTVDRDDTIGLNTIVLGDTASALSALEATLVEVCKTSGFPLTRVISALLEDC